MWWVVVVRWSGGVVRGLVNGGRAGEGWYFRIELTGILQYWQSIELRLQIIEVHQVACCKIRNPLGDGACEASKNISKKGAVCHLCPLKKIRKLKCVCCARCLQDTVNQSSRSFLEPQGSIPQQPAQGVPDLRCKLGLN